VEAEKAAKLAGADAARRCSNEARQKAQNSAKQAGLSDAETRMLVDDAAKDSAKHCAKIAQNAAEQAAKRAGLTGDDVTDAGTTASNQASKAAKQGGADGAADDAANKASKDVIVAVKKKAATNAKSSGLNKEQTAKWIAAAVHNAAPQAKRAADAARQKMLAGFGLTTNIATGQAVGAAPTKSTCGCACSQMCACCKSAPLAVISTPGGVWVPATQADAFKNRAPFPVITAPGGIWVPSNEAAFYRTGRVPVECGVGCVQRPVSQPYVDPHMLRTSAREALAVTSVDTQA
jgi:hypothetical protein